MQTFCAKVLDKFAKREYYKNEDCETQTCGMGGEKMFPNLLGQKAARHLTDEDMAGRPLSVLAGLPIRLKRKAVVLPLKSVTNSVLFLARALNTSLPKTETITRVERKSCPHDDAGSFWVTEFFQRTGSGSGKCRTRYKGQAFFRGAAFGRRRTPQRGSLPRPEWE